MAKLFKKTKTSNLKNDEQVAFQSFNLWLMDEYPLVKAKVLALVAVFGTLLSKELAVYKRIVGSAITQQLLAGDGVRDGFFYGLRRAIKGFRSHYNAVWRAAANRLWVVIKSYGDVARKTYVGETAAITDLLVELNGKLSADVATLGLSGWVTGLETANNEFVALWQARGNESADKAEGEMKVLRGKVDEAYRNIIMMLELLAKIEGKVAFKDISRRHNVEVDKYNAVLARRGVSVSGGAGDDEDDDDDEDNGGEAAAGGPVIELVRDETTGSDNGTLTPGGVLRIFGEGLLLEGSNSSVGVSFVPAAGGGSPVPVTPEDVIANTPQMADVLIPALPAGAYKVRLATQYNDGDALLDTPRSTTFDVPLTVN